MGLELGLGLGTEDPRGVEVAAEDRRMRRGLGYGA